jgi:hypothetical protein
MHEIDLNHGVINRFFALAAKEIVAWRLELIAKEPRRGPCLLLQ